MGLPRLPRCTHGGLERLLPLPLIPTDPLFAPGRVEFVEHVAEEVVHVECDDEVVEHVVVVDGVEPTVVVLVAGGSGCTGNRGGTSPLNSRCSSSRASSCCTGEDKSTLRLWSSCCSWRFRSHSRCRKASRGFCDEGGLTTVVLSLSTATSLLSSQSLYWCWATTTVEGGLGGRAGARRRCWI